MKKSVKIILTVAACLLGAGIIIFGLSAAFIGFDFDSVYGLTAEKNSHSIENSFENVDADAVEADICVERSSDEKCTVICNESDAVYHEVYVENNTLHVKRVDCRRWYERIFSAYMDRNARIEIYLPEGVYQNVDLLSVSGDVTVTSEISAVNLSLESTSGNVSSYAFAEGRLTLNSISGNINVGEACADTVAVKCTSGDIAILQSNIAGLAEIESVSGDVDITDLKAKSVNVLTVSGDIELERVFAIDTIAIENTSGSIELDGCDAFSLSLESTSGDIKGTLLSGKIYVADTVSGNVSVPISTKEAGECNIKTVSGNVNITELQ